MRRRHATMPASLAAPPIAGVPADIADVDISRLVNRAGGEIFHQNGMTESVRWPRPSIARSGEGQPGADVSRGAAYGRRRAGISSA